MILYTNGVIIESANYLSVKRDCFGGDSKKKVGHVVLWGKLFIFLDLILSLLDLLLVFLSFYLLPFTLNMLF